MKINYLRFFIFTLLYICILSSNSVIAQVNFIGPELLCRPTDNSVTVNVIADVALQLYFEYGTAPGDYTDQTSTITSTANEPIKVVIDTLATNTRYYYRMVYSDDGGSTWAERDEQSFHTQRAKGTTFTFAIITDSHMNGGGGNVALYEQTLDNVSNDDPDLYFDLGDTFWTDGVLDAATANQRFLAQREMMGVVSHSAPIFLAPGNHENEEGWNFNDANSIALLSVNARKRYYPNPITDGFYSGNDDALPAIEGDNLREDYFAWEWGDALFVVIDPYHYTMIKPYSGTAGGEVDDESPIGDRWDWTLGYTQFQWFKQTLAESDATFKFVFAHHMVGGTHDYVRGGAEPADLFEWGGYNADINNNPTTWGFSTERPGWGDDPIHQFMVANGVSAFFYGHDHEYAYQKRDNVVYQLVPSPSMSGYGFNLYSEDDPYTIRVLPNSGHIRVTVSPEQATVEYVQTSGGTIAHSYTIESEAGPTITVTGTPLGAFTSTPGTPSTEQSYTVSGINLTDDVMINAPDDFEISLTSGTGFGSSLTLPQSEGSVASTTIYVRFNRATEGTSSGDITHASSGATTQNVAVSGTAAPPPAIIYFGDIGTATIKNNTNDVLTLTTTAAVDAGDDIIIVYASDPAQGLAVSVTDNAGNTYEEVAIAINTGQVQTHIYAAYNVKALPSGGTITFTQSGYGAGTPTARAAVASVFHGLADSGVLDQTSTGLGSSTSPSSGLTGMTTQADELLIGAIGTEGPASDATGTWQNSFTAGPRNGTTGGFFPNSNITASMGWRIVSVTGTYTAQENGITARDWAAAIATFKAGPLRYDELASDYNGTDGFNVSLSHSDGDYINATATSGTINSIHVYRIDEDAGSGTTVTPPDWFVDPLRYWGVRIFGTSPQYQLAYMYEGHPGIDDESSLRIATRTSPSDGTWVVATVEEPDQGNNTITLTGQTGTEYALASGVGDNSLPVNLTSFSAELVKGGVELKWITESQLNNAGFEIWRAADNTANYSIIASYPNNPDLAGDGNSNMRREYTFLDQTVETGTTYLYKLSDVGYSGKRTFHNVIEITVEIVYPKEYTLYPNYPNPFNTSTTIWFDLPKTSQVTLKIFNILGEEVAMLVSDRLSAGSYKYDWNAGDIASGVFLYRLEAGEYSEMRKMVLMR